MKISFYTLGCRVNQYETEMLRERFRQAGHDTVGDGEFADVYIINTCTVTHLADRKSRQHIRSMKKLNPDSIIAVTGCYAQVNPDEVAAIEAVDIVIGTNKKSELVRLVEEYSENKQKSLEVGTECAKYRNVLPYEQLQDYEETGIITSMESKTRVYIKVQEGCDRFCSYCIIPYARGKVRSRQPKDIFAEANSLVEKGFKELILTGINTALYGYEKNFEAEMPEGFEDLKNLEGIELIVAMLSRLEGDFRIRIGSLEPTVINKDYVKSLIKYDKLCHHFHLSIQSGSNNVLKAMNRKYTREEYMEIVDVLRKFDYGFGITTDIIAGFPGETEGDFADSLDIIKQCRFAKVHAFNYSKRAGTKAAEMKNHISPEIKKQRTKALIKIGDTESKAFFNDISGTVRTVLVEEIDKKTGFYTGYTDSYIKMYITNFEDVGSNENKANCEKDADIVGKFVQVRLKEAFEEGMKGELV